MNPKKKIAIAGAIILGLGLVLGLLWYYQQQGFLKIFPTTEDRRIKKLLRIDEAKFQPAQGLSEEEFRAEIQKLYERREQVRQKPEEPVAWFNFGYQREFLNDHEGAVGAWEQAFKLQPLNFVTALNLGNTYQYFLKNYERAEFYYEKALALQPSYTSAYQGLLDLYRFNWKEKQNQVEPLLLEAVKNDPANELTYYTALVEFFAASNEPGKAKLYLLEVKRLQPEVAEELLETYPSLR